MRQRAALGGMLVFLLAGWHSAVLAGLCVADGTIDPPSLVRVAHEAGAERSSDCCIVVLDATRRPALAERPPWLDPGPEAVISQTAGVPGKAGSSEPVRVADDGTEVRHPPYYLLYRRFLIPSHR